MIEPLAIKLQPILLFSLLVGLTACGGEEPVTVNFVLNNQDVKAATTQPTDLADTASLLTVNVGDSIYLVDDSEPLRAVTSRSWDLTDDGTPEVEDAESFYVAISESGFSKITLCVNGTENCVSKWIYAKSGFVDKDLTPRLTLMNYPGSMISVPGKDLHLEVEIENVVDRKELKVEIEGKADEKFKFENGLLTTDLRLSAKSNNVIITANTEEGKDTLTLIVEDESWKEPVRRQERREFHKRSKPKPVSPEPEPEPVMAVEKYSRKSVTGIRKSNVDLGDCTGFSLTAGKVRLEPKTDILLREVVVYPNECGSIVFTLSLNGKSYEETLEFSPPTAQLPFDELANIELVAGQIYTLSYVIKDSGQCPGTTPGLLDATNCGLSSRGDANLNLIYGKPAGLFNLTYNY